MLSKLKKSNNKGFTIIEVMIVLAIAGLIILIVLLAVPALQRNGRNTAIKNDATGVAAAVSEYKSNNDGASPSKTGSLVSATGGVVTIAPTSGTAANATAKVQSNTKVNGAASGPAAPAANSPTDTITVVYKYKCKTSTYAGTTSLASDNRSVVVIYAVETAGTPSFRCIDA